MDGRAGIFRLVVVWRLAFCVGIGLASSACSSSAASEWPTSRATGPAVSSGAGGMTVSGAEAMPIGKNALSVAATIRNDTDGDDRLLGGSAPGAKLGALYGTCACLPIPTPDPETGLAGKSRYPFQLIEKGGSTTLRFGDGELILTGLPAPASGTIQVTFLFEKAAPVIVDVPVVASAD